MAIIDDNNCIPSGLRADIMRHSMENKNLLSAKGSIYVGTGETVTVGGEKIYKTRVLQLGSEGELLTNINGTLQYSKLINEHFDSTLNYSNLSSTFNSFNVLNSQFSGEYSSLRINKDNFSADQSYLNLLRFSDEKIDGPWGTKLYLALNDNKYLEIKTSSTIKPLKKYSVIFTNVNSSSLGFSNVTLVFNHIMQSNAYSYLGVLRDYVDNYGEVTSSSGIAWTGWCIPSVIDGDALAAAALSRVPLKIEVVNSEPDPACNIYVYDGGTGKLSLLSYSGWSFDMSGVQIF